MHLKFGLSSEVLKKPCSNACSYTCSCLIPGVDPGGVQAVYVCHPPPPPPPPPTHHTVTTINVHVLLFFCNCPGPYYRTSRLAHSCIELSCQYDVMNCYTLLVCCMGILNPIAVSVYSGCDDLLFSQPIAQGMSSLGMHSSCIYSLERQYFPLVKMFGDGHYKLPLESLRLH